jgi:hypothetical protein
MLGEKEGSDKNCRISSTDSSSNDMASLSFKSEQSSKLEGMKNDEEKTLSRNPRVRFSAPSEIPVEVKVAVTVLELRGVFLDKINNREKSLNNETFCLDGLRACISVPSGTSNISTHFPSRPFQLSSNHLDHMEAIASWKNSDDNKPDEECHLAMNLTQVIGIDGMDTDDVAFMLNVISLPVNLIYKGKMIPFGIAQMVVSNLSLIPSEAILSVVDTGIAKGRTVATLAERNSNLSCHSNEGHSVKKVQCVDNTEALRVKSLRKRIFNKVKLIRTLPHRMSSVTGSTCKVKYPEDRACTLRVRIDVQRVLS